VTASFFENEILPILGTDARVLPAPKGTSVARDRGAAVPARRKALRFLRLKRRANTLTVSLVAAGP